MASRKEKKAIRDALKTLTPAMRREFEAAINSITSQIDARAFVAAIEAGDIERAVLIAGITPAALSGLQEAIRNAHRTGAQGLVDSLPTIRDGQGARRAVHFDGTHQRAQAWVSEQSSRLITAIDEEQRRLVRETIQQRLSENKAPSQIALDIAGRRNPATGRREGGIVGLNRQQVEAMNKALEELGSAHASRTAGSNYLGRRLRDKRFDGLVKTAMESGKALTSADINKIISGYRDRSLHYRGEMIARTETIQGLRAGRMEATKQLVENNVVRADQIVREWVASMDDRTRDEHADMNGETVIGVDTPFTMPNGRQVMYPDEPNCRCVVVERVRL